MTGEIGSGDQIQKARVCCMPYSGILIRYLILGDIKVCVTVPEARQ